MFTGRWCWPFPIFLATALACITLDRIDLWSFATRDVWRDRLLICSLARLECPASIYGIGELSLSLIMFQLRRADEPQ